MSNDEKKSGSITMKLTAKVLSIKEVPKVHTDVEVEISADGKVLGVHQIRVNAAPKDAEAVAVDQATRNEADKLKK